MGGSGGSGPRSFALEIEDQSISLTVLGNLELPGPASPDRQVGPLGGGLETGRRTGYRSTAGPVRALCAGGDTATFGLEDRSPPFGIKAGVPGRERPRGSRLLAPTRHGHANPSRGV